MQVFFAPLLAMAIFICFSVSSGHAELLRSIPPTATESEAAVKSLPALGPLIKQTKPVFIFLPGIMGSKLSRMVNGKDEPFWGTPRAFLGDDPAFRYDATDHVSAQVLDDIYVKEIDKTFDVYGQAYREIKSITGVPDGVLRFPYDWRQSNVLSAADFSKWLCKPDTQAAVKDRPIIFIAHSMGGLVLKYWLEHHYRNSGCDDKAQSFAKYMQVVKIIFVGTPNFGAPKAVLAFSQGESLFFDKPNDESVWRFWAQLLHWADVNVISGNLNRYGIHYPSTYQLLPIYGKTAPGCSLSKLHDDLDFRSPSNFEASYDLFDPAAWKDLGWPSRLSGKERDDFIANELPDLLRQAKDFLCDVATYDVDAAFQGKVVNFYGLHQNTPCEIKFVPPANIGMYEPKCHGDGTVPDWIAAKDWKDQTESESDSEPHMRQVAALEFYSYLQRLHKQLYAKFASDAVNDKETQAAANVLAKLNYVPTPDPTANAEDAAKIRKVADLVVEKLNIDGHQIWEAAKTEPNVGSRANQMLVYTNLTAAEPRQRAWAFNNAAHIYLAKCNFRQSLELAKQALGTADTVQASNPELSSEMRDIRAKSAWFAAIANGQLGKFNEAKEYKAIAIRNGSQPAASHSIPTPRTKCQGNAKLYPPASARRKRS
jgi:hypothetical protein